LVCTSEAPVPGLRASIGDGAQRLDHLTDFVGRLVLDLAGLARLEIGGQRLATALQRPRDIHRESFGIEFLAVWVSMLMSFMRETLSVHFICVIAQCGKAGDLRLFRIVCTAV